MSRDAFIETVFLSTDDAIQGLWGFHSFVNAAVNAANRDEMTLCLPPKSFAITHEWARHYEPADLIAEMDVVFEYVHARNSLVLLVSLFEGAVLRFNERLVELSRAHKQKGYKNLLKWVFDLARSSQSGTPSILERLPRTCGELDNARRLRNCFSHNNGRYDQRYVEDAIEDDWVVVQPHGSELQRSISAEDKILVLSGTFERFLRSHIEVLHVIHNTIQSGFFGETRGYSYATEGKKIEWHRIFSG
ncbi:MAG: hypothetical protein WA637_09505 [Terriglobales bacterium]